MIAGVNSALGNRVAQVYVTDFGYFRGYPFPNRNNSHTSLSCYLIDSGVTEQIKLDNSWEITRGEKLEKYS